MSRGEQLRSTLAGLLGFALYQLILHALPVPAEAKQMLLPLGATSVILFTLPHSPLAQPWSVFGGLLISSLIGYACGAWIAPELLSYSIAMGVTIGVTAFLRCVHPPAGAMSVLATGAAIHGADPWLTFGAVLINAAAILAAVLVVNNLTPGRRYPHCATQPMKRFVKVDEVGVGHDDLAAALAEKETYLDISEDDLVDVYTRATRHAMQRNLGLTCADIMRTDIPGISATTPLNEAWRLMRQRRCRALPVIDTGRRVIGVLDTEDFLWHIEPLPNRALMGNVVRLFRGAKQEVVEDIMRVTGVDDLTVQMHEPIPSAIDRIAGHTQSIASVVDEEGRLVGVMTRPDALRALRHRTALELAAYPEPVALRA